MYSSRGCVENRCVSTSCKKRPHMEPRALDGGSRSSLFFLCTYVFYNLPVSGIRQTEIKHNKFKTNKSTTAASHHKSTCFPTYCFGYTGANGNESHQIQNKQVDNSSTPGPKPKITRLQKSFFLWGGSDGVGHVAREVLQHGLANGGSRKRTYIGQTDLPGRFF